MNQRNMYLTVFAVMLGIFLSVAATAQAISQPTFTANPQPGYYDEPITLTDTSGSSGIHEWDCHYAEHAGNFVAEQTGLSASCVYSSSDVPTAAQRVTDGVNQMVYSNDVYVIDRTDAPFNTILVSGTAVSLPGTVQFQTPKSELSAVCTTDGGEQCPAEVTGRSGPEVPDCTPTRCGS